MKLVRRLTFLFVCCFSLQPAFGKLRFAFLETYDQFGRLVVMEPRGRFSHVAISYRGGWIHSFPNHPVEWITDDELSNYGRVAAIVDIDELDEPTPEEVAEQIGKPFDFNFDWDAPSSTYCSKLAWQLGASKLGLTPRPMTFLGPAWKNSLQADIEGVGLSPDDLYEFFQYKSEYRKLWTQSYYPDCQRYLQ